MSKTVEEIVDVIIDDVKAYEGVIPVLDLRDDYNYRVQAIEAINKLFREELQALNHPSHSLQTLRKEIDERITELRSKND